MDCFNSLIGVRGLLDDPTNTAQLYLDDVGFDRALLEDINYTEADLKTLVNQKLDFASTQMARKIIGARRKELRGFDALESERTGFPDRKRASVAAKTGYDAGVMIELRQDRDYMKINIDSIALMAQTSGDVVVSFVDLQTGQTLTTKTVSAVADQITYVDVNLEVKSNKRQLSVGIVYDSEIAVYKTGVIDGNCSTCGGAGYSRQVGRFAYVKGISFADGQDKLVDNITNETETSGLIVHFSVLCDYDEWVCRSRAVMQLLVLYATGYELARYGTQSTRLNESTLELADRLQHLMEWNEEKMKMELETVLDNMIIPNNDYCFHCNQKSRHVTTL